MSFLTEKKFLYVRVILFGLLGALVGGLVWYLSVTITKWQLGIVAILVGLAVGWAVSYASRNEVAPSVAYISVLLTLIALFLSEYFIDLYFINEFLAAQGEYVPLWLPPGEMVNIVVESIKEAPLTLLFWGIALYESYKLPATKHKVQPKAE